MKTENKKRKDGFIALMTAIIISIILVGLMVSLSGNGLSSRFNSLNGEFKRISLGLAESCVNSALLKIGQNYNYVPPPVGEIVQIGDESCKIKSVTYGVEDPVTHLKPATIKTQADFRNSFSDIKTQIMVRNPAIAPTAPLPTCSLIASPPQVPSGQSVALQWGLSANTVSFSLDHGVGPVGLSGGPQNVTPGGVGTIIYTGTATNSAGGSAQCSTSVTVTPPPPTPSCADTVMMLDRTGSMSSGDRANERTAAKSLVTLYSGVNPKPKIGIGRFGDNNNGGLEADIVPNSSGTLIGVLSDVYGDNDGANDNDLYNAIDISTASNSSTGTNVRDALVVGNTELNSSRHTPGNKKFLILVSDGEPNEPSPDPRESALVASDDAKLAGTEIFTIHFGSAGSGNANQNLLAQIATGNNPFPSGDTGFRSPSSETHSGSDSGVAWSNASSAESNGGGSATSVNNSNSRERYYDFNLSVPVGSTINDIVVKTDAWHSDTNANTGMRNPNTNTPDTGGDGNGFETNGSSAHIDGNGNATNLNGGGDRHRFSGYNFSLPAGSTIRGIETRLDWWLDSTSGTNNMSVELSWNGGISWTTQKTTSSSDESTNQQTSILGNSNDTWGRTWNTTEFDPTNFRVRVTSNSSVTSRDFFLDWIPVNIYYSMPPSTGCQIGVELSWNGGTSWSNEQVWTLPNTETTREFSGLSNWGSHVWSSGEFSNSNFRVRVHSIDTGSTCSNTAVTNLDWLQAKVLYGTSHQPGSINDKATPALENADGDNFFIAPTSSDMPAIFDTIGKRCPALAPQCSNTVDDDGDGLIDSSDPSCHTDGDASNTNSYDPNDNDEWSTPPLPPAPPPPPPAPNITIGSWEEATSTP